MISQKNKKKKKYQKKKEKKKFSGLKNIRTQSMSVLENVSVTQCQCQAMSGSS